MCSRRNGRDVHALLVRGSVTMSCWYWASSVDFLVIKHGYNTLHMSGQRGGRTGASGKIFCCASIKAGVPVGLLLLISLPVYLILCLGPDGKLFLPPDCGKPCVWETERTFAKSMCPLQEYALKYVCYQGQSDNSFTSNQTNYHLWTIKWFTSPSKETVWHCQQVTTANGSGYHISLLTKKQVIVDFTSPVNYYYYTHQYLNDAYFW